MTRSPQRRLTPVRYEFRVEGHLDDRWASWFDGFTLARRADGTTLLAGRVTDQAALHGALRKLRDLGVTLLSVRAVDDES